MPIGLLLFIGAVVLMILNPFNGAVAVGAVVAIVIAVVTVVSMLLVATMWKGMQRKQDDFFSRSPHF